MMGRLKSEQAQLFYQFQLDDAVPEDHLVRKINTVLDFSWLRSELAPHYSSMGRPSIDPELMIRMLVVGYVFAIRSERLICREVQVNLAYRWFCKLGIEDAILDHSAFSRVRNERFREGDVFRRMFERVVETCIAAGLVGGEGFAVTRLPPDLKGRPYVVAHTKDVSALRFLLSSWPLRFIGSVQWAPRDHHGSDHVKRRADELIE